MIVSRGYLAATRRLRGGRGQRLVAVVFHPGPGRGMAGSPQYLADPRRAGGNHDVYGGDSISAG